MKVFLIRHTAVAVPEGICYGATDVPLADQYKDNIAAVKAALPARFDAVYSSPLRRCWTLAGELGPDMNVDERLTEYNFGRWEMRAWDSLKGPQAAAWFADFVRQPAPGGDSYEAMARKVADFWEGELLPRRTEAGRVAVVTHAGVIRALLANLLDLSLKNAFNLTIGFGSLSLVTCHQRHYQIEYINRPPGHLWDSNR